jgi:hypothetical protein
MASASVTQFQRLNIHTEKGHDLSSTGSVCTKPIRRKQSHIQTTLIQRCPAWNFRRTVLLKRFRSTVMEDAAPISQTTHDSSDGCPILVKLCVTYVLMKSAHTSIHKTNDAWGFLQKLSRNEKMAWQCWMKWKRSGRLRSWSVSENNVDIWLKWKKCSDNRIKLMTTVGPAHVSTWYLLNSSTM